MAERYYVRHEGADELRDDATETVQTIFTVAAFDTVVEAIDLAEAMHQRGDHPNVEVWAGHERCFFVAGEVPPARGYTWEGPTEPGQYLHTWRADRSTWQAI